MPKSLYICVLFFVAGSVFAAESSNVLEKRLNQLENRIVELESQKGASSGWEAGYKKGGGGFYVQSPEEIFKLRVLGYVQATYNYFDDKEQDARYPNGQEVSNNFGIRRARMDWLATLNKNTELFIEYDGAGSNFALVEARLTQTFHDALKVRFGKFTTQFSNENRRSSRAIDTAERYAALNSMFLLPSLDVQMGAMIFGDFADDMFTYWAGVYNGNGKASANLADDNSAKEVQLRLDARPFKSSSGATKKSVVGVSFDWDREESQTLKLATLDFTTLSSFNIEGGRIGFSGDVFFPFERLAFRGEGLVMNFTDSDTELSGGFGQVEYLMWKGASGASFSPLVRAQTAFISDDRVAAQSRLNALTVGWNAWLNENVRWQLNVNLQNFKHKGPGSTLPNQHIDSVQSQIQFKM